MREDSDESIQLRGAYKLHDLEEILCRSSHAIKIYVLPEHCKNSGYSGL